MKRQQLEEILSRHTHRMHGGTEYYSYEAIYAAMTEVDPSLSPADVTSLLHAARDPKTFDVGQWYGKTEILAAMRAADKAVIE